MSTSTSKYNHSCPDSDSLPWFLNCPVEEVYTGEFIVLDFETTGLEKGSPLNSDNQIIMAHWWDSRDQSWHYTKGNEYQMAELVEAVETTDFVVAHNAKFEAQWLKRCGVRLEDLLVWCTMIGEAVLHGNVLAANNRRSDQSLDRTAKRYGLPGKIGWVSKMIKAGAIEEVPIRWLSKYCKVDVRETRDVFLAQRNNIVLNSLLPVMFTRCITTTALADIEFNGMCLDKEQVLETYRQYEQEAIVLRAELAEMTGGINTKSTDQVASYLYGKLGFKELKDRQGRVQRTTGGKPKTDKATIAALKGTTPEQKKFVKLRNRLSQLDSALSKNLELFKGVVDEREDCVFYGQFNQTNTATHRLSSSGRSTSFAQYDKPKGCQFQNLPRVFKPLFRARRRGWVVGEADGAQLEFRVAAFVGQDVVATRDIINKEDIHAFTASVIGCSRQDAKEHTFKPLFGGQSGTRAQKKYYAAFREKYPDLAKTQQEWVRTVLREKELTVESGLKFFFPSTKTTRSGYITNTPSIYNYPIQSLATAEIIPVALVYFWHRLKRSDLRLFIINTIHDSIIVELPEEEREAFTELSKQCFGQDVYEYLGRVYGLKWNVPLGLGVKCGEQWSVGEEFSYDFPAPYEMRGV